MDRRTNQARKERQRHRKCYVQSALPEVVQQDIPSRSKSSEMKITRTTALPSFSVLAGALILMWEPLEQRLQRIGCGSEDRGMQSTVGRGRNTFHNAGLQQAQRMTPSAAPRSNSNSHSHRPHRISTSPPFIAYPKLEWRRVKMSWRPGE